MRATAAPAIRAKQAKGEVAPPGLAPRVCDWHQLEASVRKRFHAVLDSRQPFFTEGSQHLVILVDGKDAEKPVVKSLLDEWLDPARQSSKLLASPEGRAFLDSIDPAYAPVVLQGEPGRVRALRAELFEIAQGSNKLVAQMGLIEREDLAQLSLADANDQYRSWLAEARMAGLAKESMARLDALLLRFISVGGRLRNQEMQPHVAQQALISEGAVPGGCSFTVLVAKRGGDNKIAFSMDLRGLAIHASNPSAELFTPPSPSAPLDSVPRSWTASTLISAMRDEHGVELELLGLNSRRATPAQTLSGKLLLVSASGEQDDALQMARPFVDLLRQGHSKDHLSILRAPHTLALAANGALVYDLADELEAQIEELTLKSSSALSELHGFLLRHGMQDLIDESAASFSVPAARQRIDGLGRGRERDRGLKLLHDYEHYEHAAAHMHRRRWRGLFMQMANYLEQPLAAQGVALMPMAAEDAQAVLQFLHDDRELSRRLQDRVLEARLRAVDRNATAQERVELM